MEDIFEEHRKKIKDLLLEMDVQKGNLLNGYSSDKQVISRLFKTSEKAVDDILLRLTVIDSMYSTQMDKRYYGLEDLANALFTLQTEKKRSLAELFTEFTKTQNASLFDYSDGNLWAKSYGIRKDGTPSGIAISLTSKYAYFTTNFRFPIFDTIVCEMLPSLSAYLGIQMSTSVKQSSLQRFPSDEKMVRFVTAINEFISKLDSRISYDALDRLLWFVGKIRRGNLSLILSRDEYLKCAAHLKVRKGGMPKDVIFDIAKDRYATDISPFLHDSNKPLMKQFFKLAKELG